MSETQRPHPPVAILCDRKEITESSLKVERVQGSQFTPLSNAPQLSALLHTQEAKHLSPALHSYLTQRSKHRTAIHTQVKDYLFCVY